MSLPGIFEVYQLAIGPSTLLTTGALRIGQAFRDVLLAGPYRSHYRIIIELLGNFASLGRENRSDQAVIAGLGGFSPEDPNTTLQEFYGKIRENGFFTFLGNAWPFNPESDLTFNLTVKHPSSQNCIRFHLVSSDGQPAFQAEYHAVGNGLVNTTGIKGSTDVMEKFSPLTFTEIKNILDSEKITLPEFIISGECARHRISRDHFQKRMLSTWKLMIANTEKGLQGSGISTGAGVFKSSVIYKNYLSQLQAHPNSNDSTRASIYAMALSEEIRNHHLVITAPTCSGSAIVPAVLRYIQEKYLFTDEKIVEGLIVGGLFGSLILHQLDLSNQLPDVHNEVAYSAIVASAALTYLMGGSIVEIENAGTLSVQLYGRLPHPQGFPDAKSFLLQNSMVAQTLPAMVDLARILPKGTLPEFDTALATLFS